jgi:acyl-CoA thioesterase-1
MEYRFFFLFLLILIFPACANEGAEDVANESVKESESVADTNQKPKKVIFFGDSLTAAYGLDPGEGFPAIVQKKLEESGYLYKVVNAGLSGETSAGGNERVDWVLQQSVDIFVLELGGNDGLRGFDPEVTYQNLQAIIDKVKAKAPEARIILAGMEAPPNMGQEYTQAFRQVYVRLAAENDLALIPFLLKDVGGIPELNLPDGIHPNQEGQKIVAENVWEVLQPLLDEVG